MKHRPDFVNVRLTAAGEKMVGDGGSLTFQNRHLHYTFKPGEEQEVVLRYEWGAVLSKELFEGEPIFELVPAEAGEERAVEGETDGSL